MVSLYVVSVGAAPGTFLRRKVARRRCSTQTRIHILQPALACLIAVPVKSAELCLNVAELFLNIAELFSNIAEPFPKMHYHVKQMDNHCLKLSRLPLNLVD